MATKLGKGLAALTTVPATLSTPEAASNDETGSAVRLEQSRYEQAILDFEVEVRKRRDALCAEHLERMAAILSEPAE
jgi:hypothetical protein